MTELKAQLKSDLTAAMKARDEARTRTLRMLLAAITNEEVAGKAARELSDDEILLVVGREVKKRKEAAEAFSQGGREAKAAAEREESEILAGYLPAQLSDVEVAALVSTAIETTGATDVKGLGKVMQVLRPQIAGRAEGGRVAAEARRQLGA